MNLLLTSSGIKNASIRRALVDLLGKPIADSSALFIPTAIYPFPGGAGMAWRAICGKTTSPLCELGWKSMGVLELSALPSIDKEVWVPMVRETDALLVWGGDVLYLTNWMRQSGLADLLPSLSGDAVYVGVSAGSMIASRHLWRDLPRSAQGQWRSAHVRGCGVRYIAGRNQQAPGHSSGTGIGGFRADSALGPRGSPGRFSGQRRRMGRKLPVPTYAIDDETAVKVTNDGIEVVSEGHWKLFAPDPETR